MIDRTGFILANTRLLAPPLVPEIRLHLAEESLPIWRKTEEELGEMGLPPPYWAFAWAGGQALARYVLDHPGEFEGKTVLDIGAGSGLAAIAASKAGARQVAAADIDALAVSAMGLNAAANNVAITATTDDWLSIDAPQGEILLVGDLFYERPLAERTNMVFRGTTIVYGHGVMVVTSTGMQTELGRIAELIQSVDDDPTPLQRRMSEVGKVLVVAALVTELERKFKRKVSPHVRVDRELIGGVRVTVGDEVIDGSVRSKLAAMATAIAKV